MHGDDAARGLGAAFTADSRLAAAILARLFPWLGVGPGEDPWEVLLWANGRIDLAGRAHQGRWRWQCAPLSEWDGPAPCMTNPMGQLESARVRGRGFQW